jgi:hypothetical protein
MEVRARNSAHRNAPEFAGAKSENGRVPRRSDPSAITITSVRGERLREIHLRTRLTYALAPLFREIVYLTLRRAAPTKIFGK